MVLRWEISGVFSLLASILLWLVFPSAPAAAADVDELLRLGEWLHGPPAPAEPLYAHA